MSGTVQEAAAVVDQDWADVVCLFWDKCSFTTAEQRLHAESLVALQPLALRARTALLVGNRAVLDSEWPELLPFWLECCHDEHSTVKSNANSWLCDTKDQHLRNAICLRAWACDCGTSQAIALSELYVPTDLTERSLFYFYSCQWNELECIDPQLDSLTSGYQAHSNLDVRKRFCSIASKQHRIELVVAMTRKYEAIDQLSEVEFATAVNVLAHNNEIDLLIRFINDHVSGFNDELWQETLGILKPQPESLWKLAAFAPTFWAMKCLQLLTSWEPPDSETKKNIAGLLEILPPLQSTPTLQWRWLGAIGFERIDGIHLDRNRHDHIATGPENPLFAPSFLLGECFLMDYKLLGGECLFLQLKETNKSSVFFTSVYHQSDTLSKIATLTTYPDRLLTLRPVEIPASLLNEQIELLDRYAAAEDRILAESVFATITWAQQQQRLLKKRYPETGAYRLLSSDDVATEASNEITEEAGE